MPSSQSVAAPASGFPQPGSQAYANFVEIVSEETIFQADINPGGTGTDGAANWLTNGESACALLGQQQPSFVVGVVESLGYDATGAEAIVDGAARYLCPDTGYTNYTTDFDTDLDKAASDISYLYNVQIDPNNVRRLAQVACQYFGNNDGEQLYSYLRANPLLPEPPSGQQPIDYTNIKNERHVVVIVQGYACPSLTIPQDWYDYS